MDISFRQKTIKEILALNDMLGQIDLTDLYKTVHPKANEYTYFSSAHEAFYRIDHMLARKQVLINLRRLKSY